MNKIQTNHPTPEKLTLTVDEAGAALGLGRASAYEAVRTGQLPSIRVGRRILVPRRALELILSGVGLAKPKAR